MNDTSDDGPAVNRHAVRIAERNAVLTSLGVTHPEAALFVTLSYGFLHEPAYFPRRAAGEYSAIVTEVTTEECRAALTDCLAKGWLQVLDERTVAAIAEQLRRDGVIGPIYDGLSEVGCVDFTPTGAELWLRISAEWSRNQKTHCPIWLPFADCDLIREKTAYYFRSQSAALRGIEKLRDMRPVSITDPVPIGAWRAQWWRRFDEGYRVDADWRTQGQGRGAASEHCSMEYNGADLTWLQPVLDRHNVTLAEWLAMESMEFMGFSPNLLYPCIRRWAQRRFGLNISAEECRTGLEACMDYGWLRITDASTDEEIRSMVQRDSAILAVPTVALNCPKGHGCTLDPADRTKLIPVPWPKSRHYGKVDFSSGGAELYRMVQAEWLGANWEDNLLVECPYYWEEHHYCESEAGFESIVPEHIADGMTVLANRVVPIGPWCVYWWKQFPAGYRLEVEICSPAAEPLDPKHVHN